MDDKLKKSIVIIVLLAVNIVLIGITAISVTKSISHVFETGGVSNTDVDGNEISQEDISVDDSNINTDESETTNEQVDITLEIIPNEVKVIVTAKEYFEYIQYSFDDGESEKIEVGNKEYQGTIEVPEGEHNLKLQVIDGEKVISTKEELVVGDSEPTINLKLKRIAGELAFIIDAEDDENIKKVEIIHNGGQKQIIEVNEKTYHKEIIMTKDEINTLEVTVININDLSKTRKGKYENK